MSNEIRALADSIIAEVENRLNNQLGNAAYINYKFGSVQDVSGNIASVSFTGGMPLTGVRVPANTIVHRGSYVRVAVQPDGDAFITEVY